MAGVGAAMKASEGALAREVLRITPRHTRREAAVTLAISIPRIHALCRQLLQGRRLLSDWDIEILGDRHRKPGRVPAPTLARYWGRRSVSPKKKGKRRPRMVQQLSTKLRKQFDAMLMERMEPS